MDDNNILTSDDDIIDVPGIYNEEGLGRYPMCISKYHQRSMKPYLEMLYNESPTKYSNSGTRRTMTFVVKKNARYEKSDTYDGTHEKQLH